jgi:hypothetical protein
VCEGRVRALADDLPSPSEDSDLAWLDVARVQVAKPAGESSNLVLDGLSPNDFGFRTAQYRYRLAGFLLAIDFRQLCRYSKSEKRRISALVR